MYKILIVEDDLPMAQAIQKEMRMWGNEAEYVQDFQNVLTAFTEYDPHLVLFITDITGAARSAGSLMCRSYLSPPHQII